MSGGFPATFPDEREEVEVGMERRKNEGAVVFRGEATDGGDDFPFAIARAIQGKTAREQEIEVLGWTRALSPRKFLELKKPV